MNEPDEFFITSGTLRINAPSYVTRPADRQLYEYALAGEFCYVLTSRQMGKSSLMVRTAQRLEDAGRITVKIDLTAIGSVDADKWYLGLLMPIRRGLRLTEDVQNWWDEHQHLSAPQRLIEFLHDIVLARHDAPIVIFIDEIDSTLNLPFRDDFFAAIRAMYNARAADLTYRRLTFVLLGVAAPTDLIQDRERTPFNIGRQIDLQEFSPDDALVLARGLDMKHVGQGERILDRILYWTSGHPYLTQKLCLAAAQAPPGDWNDTRVDALVETTFFSHEARKDANLIFIRDRVQASPTGERRQILKLYRQVWQGRSIADDDRSLTQNHLELVGLVRARQNRVCVSNRIYQRTFDQAWIAANIPADTQRTLAVVAILVALVLVVVATYFTLSSTPNNVRAQNCTTQFLSNSDTTNRIANLACLFDLDSRRDQYDEQALQLFYRLSPAEQFKLFQIADPSGLENQLISVVGGIYVTLPDLEPQDDRDYDETIMEAMMGALDKVPQSSTQKSNAQALRDELALWEYGRQAAKNRNFTDAFTYYDKILNLNEENVSAHYDRAILYLNQERYLDALRDFREMVKIAEEVPTPVPPTQLANTTSNITTARPGLRITPISSTSVAQPEATPATTLTATAAITATATSPSPEPSAPAELLRFVGHDQIVATIADAVGEHNGLIDYLRQNRTAENQDFVVTVGLLLIVQAPPPVSPTAASASEVVPELIAVGKLLEVDGWTYTFPDASYVQVLGKQVGSFTAKGTYLHVLVWVANNTGTAQPLPANFFALRDAQGNDYTAQPQISSAAVQRGVNADASMEDPLPANGVLTSVYLVFDVPTDPTNLVLFARNKNDQGWLVLPFVAAAPTAPAATRISFQCVVGEQSLRMRSGPGASYPIVERLALGMLLLPLGQSPDQQWINVREAKSEVIGWVAVRFVKCDGDVASLPVVNVASGTELPSSPTPSPTPQAPVTPTPPPLTVTSSPIPPLTLTPSSVTYRVDVVKISSEEMKALPGCENPGPINNACIVGPSRLDMVLDSLDTKKTVPFPSDVRLLTILSTLTRIRVVSDSSGVSITTIGNNEFIPEIGAYYKIVVKKIG